MRERPILFSGPMVRAILEGRKTQTRRVVKPQPTGGVPGHRSYDPRDGSFGIQFCRHDGDFETCSERFERVVCPYGSAGEGLWVRETWARKVRDDGHVGIVYEADAVNAARVYYPEGAPVLGGPPESLWMRSDARWRRSIHMPRWASRLTLEITGVRIERLQQITEADAIAEGARRFDHIEVGPTFPNQRNPSRWFMEAPPNTDHCLGSARFAFANYWNALHAKRGHGWDTNPWVWVVEFRRTA